MKMRGNDCLTMLLPLVEAYIGYLRCNPIDYPKRAYTRLASGHKVRVGFSVRQIRLQGKVDVPGPINVVVEIDDEVVFRADIGGSAAFMMMDGLKPDTPVEIESEERYGHWLDILEQNIPYLMNEASIYL